MDLMFLIWKVHLLIEFDVGIAIKFDYKGAK